MKQKSWILACLLWWACGSAYAQTNQVTQTAALAQSGMTVPQQRTGDKDTGTLDAKREKHAAQVFLTLIEKVIVAAADAMPADKYGFAPTDGEFKGVRTFGQMVKHLSATNHILAAAALGEEPPADAGDEVGPETVRTKAEVLDYLKQSFVHLNKAIDAIGQKNATVNASPISPLKGAEVTRLALVMESLIHAFDHYGQMVEYLRMNGVVPPASRP
jgi:uncharacterized damage-inducible protein DinB